MSFDTESERIMLNELKTYHESDMYSKEYFFNNYILKYKSAENTIFIP